MVVLLLSAVIVLAANSFCGWCSGSDDDGGGVVCVCSVLESNGGESATKSRYSVVINIKQMAYFSAVRRALLPSRRPFFRFFW